MHLALLQHGTQRALGKFLHMLPRRRGMTIVSEACARHLDERTQAGVVGLCDIWEGNRVLLRSVLGDEPLGVSEDMVRMAEALAEWHTAQILHISLLLHCTFLYFFCTF